MKMYRVQIYPPNGEAVMVFNACTNLSYLESGPLGFMTSDGKTIETTLPWFYAEE